MSNDEWFVYIHIHLPLFFFFFFFLFFFFFICFVYFPFYLSFFFFLMRILAWSYRDRDHDRKVASSNPWRSGGRIFFSRVNFVCWLLFGVCFTPVLLQWHVKDPSHSAKIAGGRLHINTLTPLTQQNLCWLTVPLFRQSVGTYPETSSDATCQGTFSQLSRLAGPLCA